MVGLRMRRIGRIKVGHDTAQVFAMPCCETAYNISHFDPAMVDVFNARYPRLHGWVPAKAIAFTPVYAY